METQTINLTPTWSGMLPLLLELTAANAKPSRDLAHSELRRMARLADLYVAERQEPAEEV
jgi:hypothetical protein